MFLHQCFSSLTSPGILHCHELSHVSQTMCLIRITLTLFGIQPHPVLLPIHLNQNAHVEKALSNVRWVVSCDFFYYDKNLQPFMWRQERMISCWGLSYQFGIFYGLIARDEISLDHSIQEVWIGNNNLSSGKSAMMQHIIAPLYCLLIHKSLFHRAVKRIIEWFLVE